MIHGLNDSRQPPHGRLLDVVSNPSSLRISMMKFNDKLFRTRLRVESGV